MEKNNTIVRAVNKNVRTSPRKLSLVCNFIKGKKVDVALRDLEFSRKRIQKVPPQGQNQQRKPLEVSM